MKDNDISIVLLQETHVNLNVREQRKHFTWLFAGDVDKKTVDGKLTPNTEAGVAIVIDNELLNFIWDIQPISDRIMTLTLGYRIPINFVNSYSPHAKIHEDIKYEHYDKLKSVQLKLQGKGPTYTAGDFNARLQKRQTYAETCIGQHTFDKRNHTLATQTADVVENRNLLITHCMQTSNVIIDTFFPKSPMIKKLPSNIAKLGMAPLGQEIMDTKH